MSGAMTPPSYKPEQKPGTDHINGQPKPIYGPLIDKLSLTLALEEKHKEDSRQAFWALENGNPDIFKHDFCKRRGYKCFTQLCFAETKESSESRTMQIWYGPAYDSLADFCFEWNPHKFGLSNLHQFKLHAGMFLPDGYDTIIELARLSRIDVACDMPGRSIHSTALRAKSKRISRHVISAKGRLETIYGGSSKGSQIVAYDKEDEALEKRLRIEFRLRPQKLRFRDLPKYTVPFGSVQVACADSLQLPEDFPVPLPFLVDSLRVRGIHGVRKLLAPYAGKHLLEAISTQILDFWEPETLQERWQHTLATSELLAPLSELKVSAAA